MMVVRHWCKARMSSRHVDNHWLSNSMAGSSGHGNCAAHRSELLLCWLSEHEGRLPCSRSVHQMWGKTTNCRAAVMLNDVTITIQLYSDSCLICKLIQIVLGELDCTNIKTSYSNGKWLSNKHVHKYCYIVCNHWQWFLTVATEQVSKVTTCHRGPQHSSVADPDSWQKVKTDPTYSHIDWEWVA